jgi:Tfp pilus assembly major pilin PilA
MRNKKGFTFITLLMVLIIIGLSSLIGLKYYGFNQQDSAKSNIAQDKAKDTIVQTNITAIHGLLQGALITGDIDLAEAISLSQNAGLHNPYTETDMNKPECFPEIADSPGEIQIILKEDTFYIQGYGSNGLLSNILTVKK